MRKKVDKPTVITDTTSIPRQTHYACPYCMSKLEITTENMKITSIQSNRVPNGLRLPAKCAHFSGLLDSFPSGAPLPDECLICPKPYSAISEENKEVNF